MNEDRPDESAPGEKGPPAWKERSRDRATPIPDEPPDSSSEVGQVAGPASVPPRRDADGHPEEDDDERTDAAAGESGPEG